MKKVNIGVLGSGFIVSIFYERVKNIKQINLAGIWGRHLDKLEKYENFEYKTTDLDKILNDPNIDIIYIALPNSLHYEYALKALKANKNIILEKPFCENLTQAKKLVKIAKEKKLFLFEAIMPRSNPFYLRMKKDVKKLDGIKMIEGNFSQYSRKYNSFKQGVVLSTFDYKLAGGALMDLGIYNIHFIVDMFGKPLKAKYFGNIRKKVDTSGVLILKYKDFIASMINAKDCRGDGHILIEAENGYLRCNTTPSRTSDYTICIDGKTKNYHLSNDEFCGWDYLYKDILNIYNKKDYKKCYEYLDETLLAQSVLDAARKNTEI